MQWFKDKTKRWENCGDLGIISVKILQCTSFLSDTTKGSINELAKINDFDPSSLFW